jgi:hypothetical protein
MQRWGSVYLCVFVVGGQHTVSPVGVTMMGVPVCACGRGVCWGGGGLVNLSGSVHANVQCKMHRLLRPTSAPHCTVSGSQRCLHDLLTLQTADMSTHIRCPRWWAAIPPPSSAAHHAVTSHCRGCTECLSCVFKLLPTACTACLPAGQPVILRVDYTVSECMHTA